MTAMTTELAIEREANLRAQKKKILQLQRLKYSSDTLKTTDDNVALAGADKHVLFEQENRASLSGYHQIAKEENTVACGRVGESATNNSSTVDKNYGKVNKFEHGETPGFERGNRTPVSPRRERTFTEEITENYDEGTETDGRKISIVIDNAEPELYTPSFASASSEYHRKTTEIRKKADERRRNVLSPSIRHSSVVDMRSNNADYLTVYDLQPRRSTSLTELNWQHDDFDSKRTNTGHRSRSEMFEREPQAFGERSSLPRTSSWSSIYEPFPAREKEDMNFQGFARRQQEMLEDNLRRVEENLDTTFSKLRRYVNTGTALSSTESLGQS